MISMKITRKQIQFIQRIISKNSIINNISQHRDYSIYRKLIKYDVIYPYTKINYNLLGYKDYFFFLLRKNYDYTENRNYNHFKDVIRYLITKNKFHYWVYSSFIFNFHLINFKSKIIKELLLNNYLEKIKEKYSSVIEGYFLKRIYEKRFVNFQFFDTHTQKWEILENSLFRMVNYLYDHQQDLPFMFLDSSFKEESLEISIPHFVNINILRDYLKVIEEEKLKKRIHSLNKIRDILKVNWNDLLLVNKFLREKKIILNEIRINPSKILLKDVIILLLNTESKTVLNSIMILLSSLPYTIVKIMTDFFDSTYYILIFSYLPRQALEKIYIFFKKMISTFNLSDVFFSYTPITFLYYEHNTSWLDDLMI